MPWFRVDDSFWGHPKAIAAGDALALWLRAGCWSAQQLTDGFIPKGMLATLGGTPAKAKRLVDAKTSPTGAGLWVAVEGGWKFHDWGEYQPTSEDVRDKRRKRAEAGRLGGLRSGQTRGKTEASGEALASGSLEPPARPGPARTQNPLLTLAGRLGEVDARELSAGLPAEVIAEWQAIAGPGIDLEREARAYLAHHGDQPPRHPRRAWLGWLQCARDHGAAPEPRQAPPRPPCATPGCVDGWLPDDDTGRPVPCPTCRPHLRPVPTTEAS